MPEVSSDLLDALHAVAKQKSESESWRDSERIRVKVENDVTNKKVIALLISVCLITLVGITSPFWTGQQQLARCTVNLLHVKCVMTVNVVIALVCICLHIKIFLASRATIRRYPRHTKLTTVQFSSKKTTSGSLQGVKKF